MAERQKPNPFYNKDFITVEGLSREAIQYLFERADFMKGIVNAKETWEVLEGYAIPIIFFEESTRTYMSFVAAAQRLGAYVTEIPNMKVFSSVAKGESFEDTIRSVESVNAASAIVIRDPEITSSRIAAEYSEVPIINGGSGTEEHPTQALLDLYTIQECLGRIDGLKIALVGDLKHGRTVKSLAKLAASIGVDNEFRFVSTEALKFPPEFFEELPPDTNFTEVGDLESVIEWADIVYMTRTQKERLTGEDRDQYEILRDALTFTREMADRMKPESIIMHPLPRTTELRYRVDKSPKAVYFRQMKNGLFVRMALLESILMKKPKKKRAKKSKVKQVN